MQDLKGSLGILFIALGMIIGILTCFNFQLTVESGIAFLAIGVIMIIYERYAGSLCIWDRFRTINETRHYFEAEIPTGIAKHSFVKAWFDTDEIPGLNFVKDKKRNGIITEDAIDTMDQFIGDEMEKENDVVLMTIIVLAIEDLKTHNDYLTRLRLVYLERLLRHREIMLNDDAYNDVMEAIMKASEDEEISVE